MTAVLVNDIAKPTKAKERRNRAVALRARLWQAACGGSDIDDRLANLEIMVSQVHWALIGQWCIKEWQPGSSEGRFDEQDGMNEAEKNNQFTIRGAGKDNQFNMNEAGKDDQNNDNEVGNDEQFNEDEAAVKVVTFNVLEEALQAGISSLASKTAEYMGKLERRIAQMESRPRKCAEEGVKKDVNKNEKKQHQKTCIENNVNDEGLVQDKFSSKARKFLDDLRTKLSNMKNPHERNKELDATKDMLSRRWTSIQQCTALSREEVMAFSDSLEQDFRTA